MEQGVDASLRRLLSIDSRDAPSVRLLRLLRAMVFQLERHVINLSHDNRMKRDLMFEMDSFLEEMRSAPTAGSAAVDRKRLDNMQNQLRSFRDVGLVDTDAASGFGSIGNSGERDPQLVLPDDVKSILKPQYRNSLRISQLCAANLDAIDVSYLQRVLESLKSVGSVCVLLQQTSSVASATVGDSRLTGFAEACHSLAEEISVLTCLVGPPLDRPSLAAEALGSLPSTSDVMQRMPKFSSTAARTQAQTLIKNLSGWTAAHVQLLEWKIAALHEELSFYRTSPAWKMEEVQRLMDAFQAFDANPSEQRLKDFLRICKEELPRVQGVLARRQPEWQRELSRQQALMEMQRDEAIARSYSAEEQVSRFRAAFSQGAAQQPTPSKR